MFQHTIDTQGYAIIPDVFAPCEIGKLSAELDAVPLRRSRAGARHLLRHAAVSDWAGDARLLTLARQILGPDALPFRATLFDKSPNSNWLIVWHQDTALPLTRRHQMQGWGPWSVKDGVTYAHAPSAALEQVLALRVHLDDSTERNGPLRILPGTHKLGVLSDDTIEQLATQIDSVACLVAMGGVVAMRPLLVHASSKSQSETKRRVLHIEYVTRPTIADGVELTVA